MCNSFQTILHPAPHVRSFPHRAPVLHNRYSVVLTLALTVFVVVADRALLPPAVPWLGGPYFAGTFASVVVLICLRVVAELNFLSMISMYSGLFSQERAVPLQMWNGISGLTCKKLIVDRLVRKVCSIAPVHSSYRYDSLPRVKCLASRLSGHFQ